MRKDDFQRRREHLKNLSEEELQERFFSLAQEIVEPLLSLARTHTSPSIERSVLLRMGCNSLEAKELVKKMEEKDLLGHGAGHIIYALAKEENLSIKEAYKALVEENLWERVEEIFRGSHHETR